MIPPPSDFFPIVVARCPGCSRRLRALAPLAWPVRVPLPGRCDACGAWLKVELSKPVTETTEAATTEAATEATEEAATKSTVEGAAKAAAQETDVSATARVGPEALIEWPLPSLAELEEK